MSIRDKFAYVTTKEQDQTLIGIKEGKFAGVIYKYGKVSFGEDNPDGTKPLQFQYEIVDNNGIPIRDHRGKVIVVPLEYRYHYQHYLEDDNYK